MNYEINWKKGVHSAKCQKKSYDTNVKPAKMSLANLIVIKNGLDDKREV